MFCPRLLRVRRFTSGVSTQCKNLLEQHFLQRDALPDANLHLLPLQTGGATWANSHVFRKVSEEHVRIRLIPEHV
jgi:hypothetical protein